jgi:hypothetical protein
MKSFEEVWKDVQTVCKTRKQIETICQKSVNEIIEANSHVIKVSSHRSKKHKVRVIPKEDFEYVWEILSKEDVCTLDQITKIIGRRAITCAILALHVS